MLCLGGLAYTRTVHNDAQGRAILEQWDIHGPAMLGRVALPWVATLHEGRMPRDGSLFLNH
jgi:hypothetical protein